MQLINLTSLDMTNMSLRTRLKNAIKTIKSGASYNSYVIRADGRIIKFEFNPSLIRGYSKKTLYPRDYYLNQGS